MNPKDLCKYGGGLTIHRGILAWCLENQEGDLYRELISEGRYKAGDYDTYNTQSAKMDKVFLNRGQLIAYERTLSKQLNIPRSTLQRHLNKLKEIGFIRIDKLNGCNLITIVDYDYITCAKSREAYEDDPCVKNVIEQIENT
jgi:hypothetical protein